ncbi:hypothetical protein M0813_12491 [Anaeramoeba flamelloides]|uniref:H/ACA ribonucleoprotein complex subunit 2 n=1 Tax=Anaeramoeba flamelloides TaxID=1746091 RepID=A0ABQ8ZC18_9EUKA|nr:hypothetical protein M0813_12491 [Anaeramoeba flamelloides]
MTTNTEEKVPERILVPFAEPLAGKKLTKRVLKIVRKAQESKHLFRGVKEVQKALRKKNTGLCLIAADVSPMDVISHLPVTCENFSVPYLFIPSKTDLGTAAKTRRSTCCVLISPKDDPKYFKHYEKCLNETIALQKPSDNDIEF